MANTTQYIHVQTSYGRLAIRSAGSGGALPLFCIHGNSSSSEIFRPVFESKIPATRRVLAIDLPGHGKSENAKDAGSTYTMPAYAKACAEVLKELGYDEAIVLGWSLGGHIATELLPHFPGMKGLIIVSSFLLPLFPDGPPQDDRTRWNMRLDLSEEELTGFSHMGTGGPWEQWMATAAIRADPWSRRILFENLGYGDCSDQRDLIAKTRVPTALILGTDEPVHDIAKIQELKYGNLWKGKASVIQGGQHCPMWEKPEVVIPIFEEFVSEIA